MTLSELVASANDDRGRLCLGIDPRPDEVPKGLTIGDHLDTLLEACAPHVAAVKPNLAFFLSLGDQGPWMLKEVVRRAKRAGLLTVLDAKFGDVPSTTEHYARYAFDELGVHAVTANPYLGPDALAPFRDRGGCFVLARTTNPGAGLVQDLVAADGPVYEEVARVFADQPNTGLVAPGNQPEPLAHVRRLVGDDVPLLVPGVGAQGGRPEDVVAAAGTGPMLVSVSRGISRADGEFPEAQAAAAAEIAERLG